MGNCLGYNRGEFDFKTGLPTEWRLRQLVNGKYKRLPTVGYHMTESGVAPLVLVHHGSRDVPPNIVPMLPFPKWEVLGFERKGKDLVLDTPSFITPVPPDASYITLHIPLLLVHKYSNARVGQATCPRYFTELTHRPRDLLKPEAKDDIGFRGFEVSVCPSGDPLADTDNVGWTGSVERLIERVINNQLEGSKLIDIEMFLSLEWSQCAGLALWLAMFDHGQKNFQNDISMAWSGLLVRYPKLQSIKTYSGGRSPVEVIKSGMIVFGISY